MRLPLAIPIPRVRTALVLLAGLFLLMSFAWADQADAKRIVRGAKADRVKGTKRSDVMRLGRGSDRAWGRGGNDRVYGQRGNDRLYGERGSDRLYGSIGRDRLSGDSGRDRLSGGSGRDVLIGGGSADTLLGGSGNDVLRGNDGKRDMRIDGGPGRDVCYVDAADTSIRSCEKVIGGRTAATAPVSPAPTPARPVVSTPQPTAPVSPSAPQKAAVTGQAITLPGGISVPITLPLPENGRIAITGAAFSGCTRVPVLNIPLVCNLAVSGTRGDGAIAVLADAASLDLTLSLAAGTASSDGNWSAVGTQVSVLNTLLCPAGQSKKIVAVSIGVDGVPAETSEAFPVACPA